MKVTITINATNCTQLLAIMKCARFDLADECHGVKEPDKNPLQIDKEINQGNYHISIEAE